MARESLAAVRVASTVLTMKATSPFLIMSTMCGRPSATLFTCVTWMPCELRTAAVPPVAKRGRGEGFHFQQVDPGGLDGSLPVHQADGLERLGQNRRLAFDLALDVAGGRVRGQAAGRVARVHARLLDVLHDAADQHIG